MVQSQQPLLSMMRKVTSLFCEIMGEHAALQSFTLEGCPPRTFLILGVLRLILVDSEAYPPTSMLGMAL